jgi:uncharacterized protein (TIGR03435 family)
VLALSAVVGTLTAARLQAQAQAPTGQSATQSATATVPQWQIDAGGHAKFDVASVKQNKTGANATSNVPLDPEDLFTPTGGLLSASGFSLSRYMLFAYKLTAAQYFPLQSQLQKWANTDVYDIEARASGNPTKDQLRLMMQALLADRFKLAIHFEERQLPVMALVLDKPGKLGPNLRVRSERGDCSLDAPAPGLAPTVDDGFPKPCGAFVAIQASNPGRFRGGARNVPLTRLTAIIDTPQLTGIDRPVLDKTGLTGMFDFVIEFTPSARPYRPGEGFQLDESGPTFVGALKDQLGLKLMPQTGPVDVLVVDHVEEPSPN